ncbi:hypothetical protein QTO34_000173 [Cnephaeus nilssonii]|uniref:Uncharacterized protein n=1 Tax=Cnephaeus nilssonii TaxID=3371016 RepID=A0AA40LWN0_CNENI|nr:hypothetical protein QTO34_000173 [Eptesicus nilssonii]
MNPLRDTSEVQSFIEPGMPGVGEVRTTTAVVTVSPGNGEQSRVPPHHRGGPGLVRGAWSGFAAYCNLGRSPLPQCMLKGLQLLLSLLAFICEECTALQFMTESMLEKSSPRIFYITLGIGCFVFVGVHHFRFHA